MGTDQLAQSHLKRWVFISGFLWEFIKDNCGVETIGWDNYKVKGYWMWRPCIQSTVKLFWNVFNRDEARVLFRWLLSINLNINGTSLFILIYLSFLLSFFVCSSVMFRNFIIFSHFAHWELQLTLSLNHVNVCIQTFLLNTIRVNKWIHFVNSIVWWGIFLALSESITSPTGLRC